MKRSTDRILTTHVGSLPRPAEVFDALRRREQGEERDAAERRQIIRDAVAAAPVHQLG